jgi:hypothetical protein
MENNLLRNAVIKYYYIDTSESDYFVKLHQALEILLSSDHSSASFEAGGLKYLYTLESKIDLNGVPCYFISLIKEIKGWPLLFTESKSIELDLPKGVLGNITFGLVCPAHKFLLCFSDAGGGGSFKKLLGEFSISGLIRLEPLLDEKAEEKVNSWDIFKRFSIKMELPTTDNVSEFEAGKMGERVNIVSYLNATKLDLSVDAGSGKENLPAALVQDLLTDLTADANCKSLVVRGFDFEGGESEQIDLKNPQIKFKDKIELRGNYILSSDALQILKQAVSERSKELFRDR